ncbi:hypothetical protein SAMN04488066_10996 [Halorubrum aquaticum]|uniref:DUF7321 domain-containing protein n=1 Tax=Halorubrum aquaticum TaxID=387340 RepID=A0A1I3B510_9EURY|nr:hypothetical protein [Halorubrum aquaticum]SFH57280.1 hypothetical protein SAMN04488066_10996 [Halorubrum aquaticum]
MVDESVVAAAAGISVTASLPFLLYGAWIMIDTEVVTWNVLTRHLRYILVGLLLTTVPVVTWMMPRLLGQLSGGAVVHAFLGLQAYALLTFALTGIVRIFQAKREADAYDDPDADIDDLHEDMGKWRGRLRVGVAGFMILWLCAWVSGLYRFYNLHLEQLL